MNTVEDSPHLGEAEPAQPEPEEVAELPNHEDRRLAPTEWEVVEEGYPDVYADCGCGECFTAIGSPVAEGGAPVMYTDTCENPVPTTVGQASTNCRVYAAAGEAHDWQGKHERHRACVKRAADADRRFSDEWGFDAVTTVMLSFRQSPVIENGDHREWRTPVSLAVDLAEGWQPVYNAVSKLLRRKEFEDDDWAYIAVTSGTDVYSTPHRHVYLWLRDPDDRVDAKWFECVRDTHTFYVDGAYDDDHPIDPDGEEGFVTVNLDPVVRIDEWSRTHGYDSSQWRTAGASYVCSQLPHLPLGDVIADEKTATDPDLVTSAVAECSPTTDKWFTASQGI